MSAVVFPMEYGRSVALFEYLRIFCNYLEPDRGRLTLKKEPVKLGPQNFVQPVKMLQRGGPPRVVYLLQLLVARIPEPVKLINFRFSGSITFVRGCAGDVGRAQIFYARRVQIIFLQTTNRLRHVWADIAHTWRRRFGVCKKIIW